MAISYLKPKIFKIFREEALFNVNHSRKLKPLVRAVNKDPNMGLIASGCFHRHWFVNKEGTVKMKGVFKSIKHELKSKFPEWEYQSSSEIDITMMANLNMITMWPFITFAQRNSKITG